MKNPDSFALVSIHDVWPGNLDAIRRDLNRLRAHGVASPALFVVPFYHGQRPINQEPAFLEWIRQCQAEGSEVFMHGYRHLRSESLGEPARRSLFGKWANGRVRNEGEFAGLEPESAGELLGEGLEIFAKSGLEPTGFAMPAWLGRIPRDFSWPKSCRFFDGRFYVRDGLTGKCRWAPALTFGGQEASKPFAYGGVAWTAYLRRTSLVRIALHPGDLEHEGARRAVAAVLEGREAKNYSGVFVA